MFFVSLHATKKCIMHACNFHFRRMHARACMHVCMHVHMHASADDHMFRNCFDFLLALMNFVERKHSKLLFFSSCLNNDSTLKNECIVFCFIFRTRLFAICLWKLCLALVFFQLTFVISNDSWKSSIFVVGFNRLIIAVISKSFQAEQTAANECLYFC